ncbi:MAG: Spx/MgsR family RNA polymerase-binding regulatory protein [Okeania sp. SIO1H5]|uniref:Spx/MgsR family RNA polymerase-binding regulatory protein n=1 Tax=Okeania sp. SIO1H5 TaxID=2607777 RepID=UPI0013BD3EC8|nr:Spx/MgsR family RNA polymerase-binding regulatory protein [Okeania sp. SIO1H5]NET23790.1 Spx/MgsR family RNA polymerase-binding regulatory protein [Okeania sp. SIO1H5]
MSRTEPLKFYGYKGCDSCRKAKKYLIAKEIEFEEIAIREHPPTLPELRSMLGSYKGDLRRLFNASGQEYRKGKWKEKLPAMGEEEALLSLSENGHLVKRPFLVGKGVALVGFKETEWSEQFGG